MAEKLIPSLVQHELDAPPWQRFESTLMATSKLIRRAFDLKLAELGLNLSEACLLVYVVENGPLTQTQLAEQFAMGRAPVGTIVDHLSELALLRRLPNDADRRVWLLSATTEGIGLADKIAEVEHGVRARLRAGSSREEREQLAATLLRVQWNLAKIIEEESNR
jgi:MarR family transcriptional regulator for hemolysin